MDYESLKHPHLTNKLISYVPPTKSIQSGLKGDTIHKHTERRQINYKHNYIQNITNFTNRNNNHHHNNRNNNHHHNNNHNNHNNNKDNISNCKFPEINNHSPIYTYSNIPSHPS